MSTINKFLYTAALNLLLIAGGSAYSSSASALPITWTLQNVAFVGGGTASGYFTLNEYGFLGSSSIITSTVGSFTGNAYISPSVNSASPNFDHQYPDTFQITFQMIDYTHALSLVFQSSVDAGIPQINLILASSFECEGNSSCYTGNSATIANDGGRIRYVSSGEAVTGMAAIPEPSLLSLLLIAAFMRARSKKQPVSCNR